MSFAPSGITDDPEIRTASSLVDYIFRRLALSYLSFDDRLELGLASIDDMPEMQTTLIGEAETNEPTQIEVPTPPVQVSQTVVNAKMPEVSQPALVRKAQDSTAPLCYNCGNQTQRAGSCYVCSSCGSTTGCS
jgi:ribonucleoside-diphosphate reductase alpha chain